MKRADKELLSPACVLHTGSGSPGREQEWLRAPETVGRGGACIVLLLALFAGVSVAGMCGGVCVCE